MSDLTSIIVAVRGIRQEVSLFDLSTVISAATDGESEAQILTVAVGNLAGSGGIFASLESDLFNAEIRGQVVSLMSVATTAAGKMDAELVNFNQAYSGLNDAARIRAYADVMLSLFSSIEAEIVKFTDGALFIEQRDEFNVAAVNLTDADVLLMQAAESANTTTVSSLTSFGSLSSAVDAFLSETEDAAAAEGLRAAAQQQADDAASDAQSAFIGWNFLKQSTEGLDEQVQLMTQTPFYKSGLLDAGIAYANSLIEEIDHYIENGPAAISEVLRAVGGIENVAVLQDVADQMRMIIVRLSRV